MEKVKFSIILKIIFLIFEIIMIGNGIYNMSNEIIISISIILKFIGLYFACKVTIIIPNQK